MDVVDMTPTELVIMMNQKEPKEEFIIEADLSDMMRSSSSNEKTEMGSYVVSDKAGD